MIKLQNLSAINTNTIEGRLLVAAMAKISGIDSFKEPDIILQECHELAEKIYKDAPPIPETEQEERPTFFTALEKLINQYSLENGSDTPDYILSDYLLDCLQAYNKTVTARDKWFNVDMWDKKTKPADHA